MEMKGYQKAVITDLTHLSENGAFKFCDTTTTSGRDYRRGIQSLFEGIMAAYRNPAAHANLQYEKRMC